MQCNESQGSPVITACLKVEECISYPKYTTHPESNIVKCIFATASHKPEAAETPEVAQMDATLPRPAIKGASRLAQHMWTFLGLFCAAKEVVGSIWPAGHEGRETTRERRNQEKKNKQTNRSIPVNGVTMEACVLATCLFPPVF